MAVLSTREILPRTLSHRFGESPTAEMKFACTLDGATTTQAIINAVGYVHGTPHPEYSYLLMLDASVAETDLYHAEVTLRFESPQSGNADYQANPLSRPDVWSFSTSGVAVPTFRYYDGAGNSTLKPLINTAGDIIEGAQAIEGELKLTISGNRETFPAADAVAVTGALNADAFMGAAAYQWMCQGVSGQQAVEVINGAELRYWQVTAELSFKASGYQIYLPNVGWNYVSNNAKKRCYVFEEDGTTKIPSSSVMALNDDGSIRFNNDFTGSGAPSILTRRVNPSVNFATYFGAPPF